ncbi:GNAT family N-acetyltransferase [Acinetobacter haemolyticus]|uniref:GNAT family N-acetyltransferase n=2 Tax=Acinetobacter haemolyticus TaxID=29430 RepID=A0AAJ2YS86_ACIHA|nr:GNAT family N-acetyltransferase [Acinetobacter haemolyticus]NAR72272.1 GNAT family N-acetyltransferase [Acinetobacter haemolyticus]NAR76935.1 GNAT family N-acetyltransferase [Acinetobacter haemolyticus]NCU23278.1 N-acetyltransferase [Acinetobacter haemolyticus]QHI20555.1 N-acetyltransferase [Acinetobacter haemolyticus]
MVVKMIETPRLILRQWRDSDYPCFAEMGTNPQVMQYFPNLLSRAESDALIDRMKLIIETKGWGFWAVELKENQQFIGFVGLHDQPIQFSFSPCVEIGWRLDQAYWGQGYASEAANAALDFAFEQLQLNKVVSFTTLENEKSQAVMKKLKMRKITEFQHPALASDHPLSRHVLYEISRKEFHNQG